MNEVTYSPDIIPPGMAAKITGISRQAIYKRMKKGTLTIHNVWGERWVNYTEITNKPSQLAATASDPSEEGMKKTCGNCLYYCPDGKCCSFTFEEKPENNEPCTEWKYDEL